MPSNKAIWTGRVISGLCVLFLLFDGTAKVLLVAPVREACAELGIPEHTVSGIGILLVVCTALYAVPRTSALGAILLTGYLGGAVSTHVRVGGPAFPVAFATLLGVLVWLGLYLREPRLRALVPFRSDGARARGVRRPPGGLIVSACFRMPEVRTMRFMLLFKPDKEPEPGAHACSRTCPRWRS